MIMNRFIFHQWAKELSQQSDGVYKEEIASRQEYLHSVGKSSLVFSFKYLNILSKSNFNLFFLCFSTTNVSGNHFLKNLFTGIEDMPEQFAVSTRGQ